MIFLPWISLCLAIEFKDILTTASSHSPDLTRAKVAFEVTRLSYKNAIAEFLPSLDINLSQSWTSSASESYGGPAQTSAGLSLSQTLFNGGKNVVALHRSSHEVEKAKNAYQQAQAKLVLDLTGQYIQYSETLESLQIQLRRVKLLKRQYQSVETLYKQGIQTREDFVRIRGRMRQSQASIRQLRGTIDNILSQFKVSIGDATIDLKALSPMSPNLSEKIPLNRPSLKGFYVTRDIQISRKLNEVPVHTARLAYSPTLSINGNYGYSKTERSRFFFDRGGYSDDWSVSVSLSFNLWDWGVRSRNIQIARLQRDSSNEGLKKEELSLNSEVQQLMTDLQTEKETLKINRELAAIEKRNFEATRQRYRKGISSFVDLINALDSYTSAEQALNTNLFRLKSLIIKHRYYSGTLHDDLNS